MAKTETIYKIVYPDTRFVTADRLLLWASDDVDNGLHEGPKPTTVEEALLILEDTGSITIAKRMRGETHEKVNLKAILAKPSLRRKLMVHAIQALQAREGINTTLEQAGHAYDSVKSKSKKGK